MFSLLFIFCVLIISYAVFNFSYSYILSYKFFSRFHLLLLVFVTSILILIRSSNLFFTIVGWDGLGVRSYLLVIYYGNTKSFNAGILTVISNRLGDILLLLSLGLIFYLGS
jgi:NADH-ubiquinone oxidoreductase chain 5